MTTRKAKAKAKAKANANANAEANAEANVNAGISPLRAFHSNEQVRSLGTPVSVEMTTLCVCQVGDL
jgi:hypothetical protein